MVPRKSHERVLVKIKLLLSSSSSSSCLSSHEVRTGGIDVDSVLQLSPNRALRAAMLKTRFADTILRAKQKKLFEYDPNATSVSKLVKAAAAATMANDEKAKKMAKEAQLQMLRAKARRNLEKIEASVYFEDNLKVVDELQELARCKLLYEFDGDYSLDTFGLLLKDSCSKYNDTEDEMLNEDIEEGEIVD